MYSAISATQALHRETEGSAYIAYPRPSTQGKSNTDWRLQLHRLDQQRSLYIMMGCRCDSRFHKRPQLNTTAADFAVQLKLNVSTSSAKGLFRCKRLPRGCLVHSRQLLGSEAH